MTVNSHMELDRICEAICDNICRWPRELENQEQLDEKCAACQTLVDLANLVEKLAGKQAGENSHEDTLNRGSLPTPAKSITRYAKLQQGETIPQFLGRKLLPSK